MRAAVFLLVILAVSGHAEWIDLTAQDFPATWTPVSGTWTSEDGVITGTANDQPAVLVSTADYFNLELELSFKGLPRLGSVGVRSHWLPDAPQEQGTPTSVFGPQWRVDLPRDITLDDKSVLEAMPVLVNPRDWSTFSVVAHNESTVAALMGVEDAAKAPDDFLLIRRSSDNAFIGGKIALIVSPSQQGTMQFRDIRINNLGREGTWRPLFNGTDFTGWKIWGTEEWTVEDGVIIGRSGPKKSEGYLATEETWKDFRVRGNFKMLGEGNFGLFYHSTIAYNEEQYPVISGLQGEVAPGYPSPTGWVYESYKRGWLVEPDVTSYRAYALRPDDWNEIEIQSIANHVTTWVNGIQVLDLTDDNQQLTEGSFALQLHAGGVDGIQWKDLYVLDK